MSKELYNKIISKLERSDEYFGYLKDIQKVNKKSFLTDYHFYGLAERYLQLEIEVVIDIGKMIIVKEDLKRPEDNGDIISVLADNKVISKKLSEKLIGVVNFRNILVHDYEKIDREIVYKKLQKNLDDFSDFKKSIINFLKKRY